MPSIPQSLLWISLVILWLFVLVPMLISKRDAVRRTSDVALATRVLTDGRNSRLMRRGPAAGHRSDPDWQAFDDQLEDDFDDAFDDREAELPTRRPVVVAASKVSPDADEDEPDYLDVDVIEEDSGALPVGASAAEEPGSDEQRVESAAEVDEADDVEAEAEAAEVQAEGDDPVDDVGDDPVEDVADDVAEDIAEDVVDDIAEGVADEAVDSRDDSHEGEDGSQEDEAAADQQGGEYEYVDDSSGLEAPADPDSVAADPVTPPRRRRYESKTAAAVAARKYRFRQRMVTTLATAMLVSALVAFFLTPTAWWVCGAFGSAVFLYLAYLRRQTRIEEELRRRRAQRQARSRLGVANTRDRDYEVVPARLRRPGAAVLDIDDEDPIFEHLDYAPVADPYDLPRAAGQ